MVECKMPPCAPPNHSLPSWVLAAGLLLVIQLEVLRALEDVLDDHLAVRALELEHDLLRRLGLLVEDGLGLATITRLLPVVTALTLCEEAGFASLVLHDLEGLVRVAPHVRAVQRLLLGEVDHRVVPLLFGCEGQGKFAEGGHALK